jgi:hypothetical protein
VFVCRGLRTENTPPADDRRRAWAWRGQQQESWGGTEAARVRCREGKSSSPQCQQFNPCYVRIESGGGSQRPPRRRCGGGGWRPLPLRTRPARRGLVRAAPVLGQRAKPGRGAEPGWVGRAGSGAACLQPTRNRDQYRKGQIQGQGVPHQWSLPRALLPGARRRMAARPGDRSDGRASVAVALRWWSGSGPNAVS